MQSPTSFENRLPSQWGRFLAALIWLGMTSASASADDAAGIDFFEKRIRPVLVQQCYECHSADAKKVGGSLLLDSRPGLTKGGETGAALNGNDPNASLLIRALRYDDDSVQMPPKGKLPATVIADFETWVRMGAPDPRERPTAIKTGDSWEQILTERRDWWSLHPVQRPPVPQPRDAKWSEHAVDRFLLARLEQEGLSPAAPTLATTLIRRLSLVLTGLPPTPEQVAAFVHECAGTSPNQPLPQAAVERLVDTLLASPHFGERWARHWMDVVRFSETHGNEWNYEVHHAWRYRDYLIRAFNADVPYDQFIREHIAGDLVPEPRRHPTERFNESVIGTAFYRFGEVNHDDCISLRQIGYDLADNQIDTLTKAFQATTVACARCHDHKLDAVSMRDYYALLGILRSSRLVAHTLDDPAENVSTVQTLRGMKSDLRTELGQLWLKDVEQLGRYLVAAQARKAQSPEATVLAEGLDAARLEKWQVALSAEKQPLEDLLEPWRLIQTAAVSTSGDFNAAWKSTAERYATEDQTRAEYLQKQCTTFADFRTGHHAGWHVGGRALRDGTRSLSGEFVVSPTGDAAVTTVLPAGCYTQATSDKLNGTLRSPVLPMGPRNISFRVIGERSSALRLVSNHCQLNYKNYRALTSPDWQWITFDPPDDRDVLQTYAELMTMFDNPKFPDQLAALGGDSGNYRLPWEKAAENPRSYFGVTQVLLHDGPAPQPELSQFRRLFTAESPSNTVELAARYQAGATTALQAWIAQTTTDDDVRWIDSLLRRGLLTNHITASPRLQELVERYRQIETEITVPRVSPGIAESGSTVEQPIFTRGDYARSNAIAPRRYLEVLSTPDDAFVQGSGRWELAERMASPTNPLTARVMVNRVWHALYGTGLVRTVDDFGHVGELPSHPELLDHLATQFVDDGWSLKRLIRSLVLTRTFQAASVPSAEARERDPQNRWLQHYPARRSEAEVIRDAILSCSGRLDRTPFGPSIQPARDKEYADRRLFVGPLDGGGRRSVYIKNNLMESPKFLAAFNLPGGKVAQGRRDVTNVPAQALALLNDPFVLQQADVWSQRLVAREQDSIASRVAAMFQSAFGRAPSEPELVRFTEAVQQLATLHQVAEAGVLISQTVWRDVAHAVFNAQEFVYIP